MLRGIAERLTATLGTDALIGRYGGEEFAVLLPAGGDTDVESVRARIGASPLITRHAGPVTVPLSAGLTSMLPGDDLDRLLGRADAALYVAKQQGRDRLVVG